MTFRLRFLPAVLVLMVCQTAMGQAAESSWLPHWPAVSDAERTFAASLAAMPTEQARAAVAAAPLEQMTPGLGEALREVGDKLILREEAKAAPIYLLGLEVAQHTDNGLLTGALAYGVGNSYYFMGENDDSLRYFALGEKILLAAQPGSMYVTRLRAARAVLRMNMGDLDGSIDDGNQAFLGFKGAGEEDGMARVLNNLGNTELAQGSFTAARQHYEEGLVLARKSHQRQGESFLLNNIANTYLQQENALLATDYCLQWIKIKEELGNKADLVTSLINLARIYERSGRRTDALEVVQRAQALAKDVTSPVSMALVLSVWGSIETEAKHYDVAIPKLQEGHALTLKTQDRMHGNEMLVQIAEAERLDGQNEAALRDGTVALQFARTVGFQKNIQAAADVVGMAQKNLGHLAEARAALEESIASVEQMRQDAAGGEQAAADFFSNQVNVFQALTGVNVAEKRWEDAFLMSEREKGRMLLDVLTHGGSSTAGDMSAREKNEESTLKAKIAMLARQRTAAALAAPADTAALAALDNRLVQAHDALSRFRERMSVAHPDMGRHRGEAQLITLAQAGSLLSSRSTAVLEYEVTDEATYLFVLTRGPQGVVLHGYTIATGAAALNKRINTFHDALQTRDPGFVAPAKSLYQLLLGPAARDLAGKTKLIVVPSGELWHLPFQALQNAAGRYVIDDYAVSFAPSLSVLRAYAAQRVGAKGSLVAFGDPARDLPEAALEVQGVARLYGAASARTFVHEAATLENYRTSALPGEGQEILLATHGVYNDRSPMDSYLLLAAAKPGMKDKTVAMDAAQIAEMKIKASLVVLSACDTAEGKYQAGEGLIGLGWSFLAAGSQATMASQWSVDSSSTTALMMAFHRGLQQKMGRAVALQKAEMGLAHNAQYRHPFYWAGFVLLGND